jgi:hypothetical protein
MSKIIDYDGVVISYGEMDPEDLPEDVPEDEAAVTSPLMFRVLRRQEAAEQTEKEWVPYVGPRGGEGWQNENDPDDVRYTDEPPGEVSDGYVEGVTVTPDTEPDEPNKYGVASSNEVLAEPFENAAKIKSSREAGIEEGNTTADSMEVLVMDDDSRVYATPLRAYKDVDTGIVDGPVEARYNNLNSPRLINRLGGNACKTARAFSPDGTEYIAKEGVDGEMLRQLRGASFTMEQKISARETMAAAYFVGNADLHAANVKIDENDDFVIIDHDNARGLDAFGDDGVDDLDRYYSPLSDQFEQNNLEMIVENARSIKNGEIDYSDIGRPTIDYAEKAADKALRFAAMDDEYNLPEEEYPEAMELIDGFEDTDNWPEPGDKIRFVTESGDIVDANITYTPEPDTLGVQYVGAPISIGQDDVNRIVEVL